MDEIINTLKSFGYTVGEADKPLLSFIKTTVENSIKIRANINEIPEALNNVVAKRTIGEFLASKIGNGSLENSKINLDPIIRTIQEGKVTITYETAGKSKEDMLSVFTGMLIAYGEEEIISFRRLRW